MKKRILSVLLLIAMLVTMIPVTAAAAVEETVTNNSSSGSDKEQSGSSDEEFVAGELQDWYVKEGLTNLFTTFGKANGVNLSAGTWTAKIGTGVATLGTKARWSKGEYGGIGFNVLYGTVAEDGTYTTESAFNNHHTSGLKLNFGISLLPEGDFTVEYLAMYKPIYVADKDGKILLDADKAKVEAYDAFKGEVPGGWASTNGTAIDNIGWYSSYTNRIDGVCTAIGGGKLRGQIDWVFDNPTWYAYNPTHNGWRFYATGKDSAYQTNNAIRSYSITLGEKLTIVPTEQTVIGEDGNPVLDDEGKETTETVDVRRTDAVVGIYRDSALYHKQNASTANAAGGTYYYDIDTAYKSNAGFSLSHSRPTDFFAARVYDRVLSVEEMKINRMVDLLLYYGIELRGDQLASAALRNILTNTLADVAFETASSAKAATRAEIYAAIKEAEADAAIVEEYAAPAHLTAFFSVYADGALDLEKGTWRNLIGGADATFGTNWTQKANGAFGFDMWAGYMTTAEDGSTTYTAGKSGVAFPTDAYIDNCDPANGYALNLGLSNLSTEDFTVEYQALYRPVLVADATKSTKDTVVYYEQDGELLAAYDIDGNNSIPDVTSWACDVFGWFSTRTMNPDGTTGWGAGNTRGSVHWMIGQPSWGSGSNYKFVGGGWATAASTAKGYHMAGVNGFYTYAVSVDETVTEAGDTEALLVAYRNGENVYSNASCINSTANKVILDPKGRENYHEYGKGYPTQTDFSGKYGNSGYGAYFYLSAGTPTDFLTVRVYDKVLTAEEQEHNKIVDTLKYYDITLPETVKNDGVLYRLATEVLLGVEFGGNAGEKAAVKAELEATIADLADDAELINQYAEPEHLVGLFTVYAKDAVDLENGTWRNLVGMKDATLVGSAPTTNGAGSRWFTNKDGSIGYNAWSGVINADKTVTTGRGGLALLNYAGNREGHLDLGLELLPDGDFSVELLAMSKPVLMADGAKSSASEVVYAVKEDGTYYQTFLDQGKNTDGTVKEYANQHTNVMDGGSRLSGTSTWLLDNDSAFDALGRFGSYDICPDGGWFHAGLENRGQMWFLNNLKGWNDGRTYIASKRDILTIDKNPFWSLNQLRTYGYYIDETVTETATEAVIGLYRDGNAYKDTSSVTLSSVATGDFYYNPNAYTTSDSRFYFGSSRPTDFYVVRVYDKVLSQADQKYNIAVDAMNYYGITLSDEIKADSVLYNAVIALLGKATFATGEAKSAMKVELEAAIEAAKDEVAVIKQYAAPEHMTALFSVFAEGSLDMTTGTWKNLVGGADATLAGIANWTTRDNGSVGFDAWAGFMTTTDGVATYKAGAKINDSTYVSFTRGAYFKSNTTYLDLNIANLSDEDFTVEYLALYRPLLIADANKSTADAVVYYEKNGALLTAYEQGGDGAIPASLGQPADKIGWFTSHTQNTDGGSGWTSARGSIHWLFNGYAWDGQETNERFVGAIAGWGSSGLVKGKDGSAFHKTAASAFSTYALSVDETKVAGGHTEALFSLYRDGAFFANNSARINSTANNAKVDTFSRGYYYTPGKDGTQNYQVKTTADGYDTVRYYDDDTNAETAVYFKKATSETKYTCYLVADNSVVSVADYFTSTIDTKTGLPNTVSENLGANYFDKAFDSTAGLYLSKNTPTDFFVVRVYDKALTAEEQKHNIAIDVMNYYGITLSDAVKNDAVLYAAVLEILAATEIVGDVNAKAAVKVEIEAKIASAAADVAYVNQYAAAEDMTSLFTVFADGTVNLANGTWRNLLGGGNATIGNKDQWKMNADGSFGFNMYFGTMIDGQYETSHVFERDGDGNVILYKWVGGQSVVSTDGTGDPKVLEYKNTNWHVSGTRLDLGINLLPADDFTVEYLAQYKPYYVTDGNDNFVEDENGNLIETYDAVQAKGYAVDNFQPTRNPGLTDSVIRIGYLNAHTYTYDGAWGGKSGTRGAGTRWTIAGTYKWAQGNSCTVDFSNGSQYFVANEGVRTYAISRDEVGADNVYGATYQFHKDGVLFDDYVYDGRDVKPNANGYTKANFSIAEKNLTGSDDAKYFWLSERHGTDFYTIRIYDRVLTEAERKFNIGVDVMNYYGIVLSDEIKADEKLYATVIDILKDASFVTGEAKAAVKVELEAEIADCKAIVDALDYSDTLYVTDGLTSLFTVFDGEEEHMIAANGSNKTWRNRVSGKANATFKGSVWALKDNGGVGKTYIDGVMAADGTWNGTNKTATPDTDLAADYSLDFGTTLLPKDDYTVEYLAFFAPKYAVQLDANGNATDELVAHYNNTYSEQGSFVDKLGYLQLISVWPGGRHYVGLNELHPRMGDAGCTTWGGTTGGGVYGFAPQTFHTLGRTSLLIDTYAVTRDETAEYNVKGYMTRQTAEITFVHNVTNTSSMLYDSDNLQSEKGYTHDYKYYLGDNDGELGFHMSKSVGVTYYAVRVYDRVLTAKEQQQNRFADFVYYYGLDSKIPAEIKENSALMDQLATVVSGFEITSDPYKSALLKEDFEDAIDSLLNTELYDLYVDGMTSHFSALTPNDVSVSVVNGAWQNRVAGAAAATFGNSNLWFRNVNGSVGYNLFYGQVSDEGVYTASSDYNTYGLTYNADGNANGVINGGTHLNLGIGLLPGGDFTVEYVAQYKPIYVADKFGNVAVDENGTPLEAYTENGNSLPKLNPGSYSYGAENHIGYLHQFVYPQDSGWENGANNARGDGNWTIASSTGWYESNLSQFTTANAGPVTGNTFTENAGVRTYAITRAVLEDDNNSRANYTFLRNGNVHTLKEYDSDTVLHVQDKDSNGNLLYNEDGSPKYKNPNNYAVVDFSVAEKDLTTHYIRKPSGEVVSGGAMSLKFWLSERHPTDFYAVRIYDRVLSAEELAQNHLVDIVIYYGLELDESVYTDEKILADSATALLNAQIVTEAGAKAANREEYQALLDRVIYDANYTAPSNYDALYITENLVGLYTAFAGDTSADVVNGIWKNKAEGSEYSAATLSGNWTRYQNGVGYRTLPGEAIGQNGLWLDEDFEDLATFTVETFATVYGLTDADGNRVVTEAEYGKFKSWRNNFRFGLLTSLGFVSLNNYNGSFSSSILDRWSITNQEYTGSSYDKDVVYNWPTAYDEDGNVTSTKNAFDDKGWLRMGDLYTPTAGLMTVTKVTDGDVNYTISYNNADPVLDVAVPMDEYNALSVMTTYTNTEGQVLPADTAEGRRFSLFNTTPATVHAVRVYAGTLTPEQAEWNAFVDKAAYYQIDIDNFAELDVLVQEEILDLFATIDTNRDAADVQALYDFYAADESDDLGDIAVAFKGIEPILANASGYRAIFEISPTVLELLARNEYTVSYGVLVAPGGVYNTLENVTVENAAKADANIKNVVVGGEGGSGIFYKLAGAGGYYFTAAVTADDAAFYGVDMIVRGYITIEKDGVAETAYDVASLNGDSQVSILDVADYFVNKFDGNLVTQYKYMNSAALRKILADSGYTARVDVGDDIEIFVDVANGNDANSGLTSDKAYKTLNAAFDAAKAHFAKAGRKTVVIRLADGTYTLTEELSLNASDILADSYSLEVVGNGEKTVIDSLVDIDYKREQVYYFGGVYYDSTLENVYEGDPEDCIITNMETGYTYIQLPGVDGVYPTFRGVYADGKLLDIAHVGSSDVTKNIDAFRITSDDEGKNALKPYPTTDTNKDGTIDANDKAVTDWALSGEDYEIAKWAIFTISSTLFPTDTQKGITLNSYKGTELHFTWIWESSAVHIDHIVDNGDGTVDVYVPYGQFPDAYDTVVKDREAWLENSYAAAVMGGGYYYDASTGRLYYPNGDFTAIQKLSYPALGNAFVFDSVENITINGLTFTGLDSNYLNSTELGMHLGQNGSITLRGTDKSVTSIGDCEHAAVFGKNLTGLTVKNVKVYDVLGAGVTVKGIAQDVVVDSSEFTNIGGSAIQLTHTSTLGGYAKDIAIVNNYVNKTGTLYRACASIMTGHTANAKIIGNTVLGSSWSSFALGRSWAAPKDSITNIVNGASFMTFNLEVAYNYVTDMMSCTGDGGAFYLNGGAVSIASDDATHYNYLHHNYVVMNNVSGLHGTNDNGWRNVYCYYFENSTSNWLSYENVLINEVNKTYAQATFYGVYLQAYVGGEARNVEMIDNYFVGFESVAKIYNSNAKNPQADFGQSASDYVYASVADLIADKTLADNENVAAGKKVWNNAICKNDTIDDDGTAVAAIFGAAGSNLSTKGKDSYLTAELDKTPAADRVVRNDGEFVNAGSFGSLKFYTVTFTDGETSESVTGLQGATVQVPPTFAKKGYTYTFFNEKDEQIDPAAITIPEGGMTVTVVAEEILYEIVFTGEVLGEVTAKLPEGAALELPAALVRPGKVATLVYEGAIVDLANFKMPAKNIEIRVTYTDAIYEITFIDSDGVKGTTTGKYDTILASPRVFAKPYHTTVYKVNDEVITLGVYKIPDGNVQVDVVYVPNTYDIVFKVDLTDVPGYENIYTYGSVKATYGEAIDASTINVADFEAGDYTIKFKGWKNFESGVTKLVADENGNLTLEVYADYVATQGVVGDMDGNGVVDITDITAVISAASGGTLDPEKFPGNPDLSGNGVVDITDITEVIGIASGTPAA